MILKELDNFIPTDKFSMAGRRAEEKVAYYLKRDFADHKHIIVLNNIRLEKDDDSCQMDHLIVHKYGMIIVESKSVSTEVRINEHNEWTRFFDGRWQGMPSPLEQARRQGILLRNHLNEYKEHLCRKSLG